jgi:hypothetical protein
MFLLALINNAMAAARGFARVFLSYARREPAGQVFEDCRPVECYRRAAKGTEPSYDMFFVGFPFHRIDSGGIWRMSHHEHSHGKEHHHEQRAPKKIHHQWWFWVAVVAMLAAMGMYVASDDEALGPGGKVNQQVPADAE